MAKLMPKDSVESEDELGIEEERPHSGSSTSLNIEDTSAEDISDSVILNTHPLSEDTISPESTGNFYRYQITDSSY